MSRDDAGGVAGDPNEHPEDNEERRGEETGGLEPGAAMVPPPRDVGSRSARAEQAKAVHGATGELAEDDGLLQTNEIDRAGVERLAEALRDEEEEGDGRRRQERREDDVDEERWASGENLHEFDGEQASG